MGSRTNMLIQNAKAVAESHNFTHRVEEVISDLQNIISVSMESVIASAEAQRNEEENGDHFSANPPEIEQHLEQEEPEGHFESISVDDLIAESYTYGKSDEQVAKEFIDDLKSHISSYAWLFVAIGIAIDNEDKRDMVKILSNKMNELKAKTNNKKNEA